MTFDALTALHRMTLDFKRLGLEPPQKMVFDKETFHALVSDLVHSPDFRRGSDPCTAVTDGVKMIEFKALGITIKRGSSGEVNAADSDSTPLSDGENLHSPDNI